MDWLLKIFSSKMLNRDHVKSKYTNRYYEGLDLFQMGENLLLETKRNSSMSTERRKQKIIASLEFFDKAIEKGYKEAEVFSHRGICLRDLNYDFDAISDFDKCIELEPERADFYFSRGITKQYIYDFEGGELDFKKAIELSKIDNENTRFSNAYAKESGFDSARHRYEFHLYLLQKDLELAKKSFSMKEVISDKIKEIKYRIKY